MEKQANTRSKSKTSLVIFSVETTAQHFGVPEQGKTGR